MKWLAASFALALSISAFAAEPAVQRDRPNWGITVGLYVPASEEIRDLFGESMLRVGLAPQSDKFKQNWTISPVVQVLSASRNGSRLFASPVTANLTKGFSMGGSSRGYVSFGYGPAYFDYRLTRGSTTYSDRTIGWNSNAEIGWLLSDNFSLESRYDWYSKRDGFDFSGWSISANLALFRW